MTNLQRSNHQQLLRQLGQQPWVVYAKKPFGGPQQVVQYLAAYTHKVAITNQRITSCNEQGQVQLRYKDYRTSQQKMMNLPGN